MDPNAVAGERGAFVPRRERQRFNRRDRKERIQQAYRSNPPKENIPNQVKQSKPKKTSFVKDVDNMDNVEDFFDSDTEYSTEVKSKREDPFQIPANTNVAASLASVASFGKPPTTPHQKNPAVYSRTPKFSSSQDKTPKAMETPKAKTPAPARTPKQQTPKVKNVLKQQTPKARTPAKTPLIHQNSPSETSQSITTMELPPLPAPPIPVELSEQEHNHTATNIDLQPPILSPEFKKQNLVPDIPVDDSMKPVQLPFMSPEVKAKKMRYSRAKPNRFSSAAMQDYNVEIIDTPPRVPTNDMMEDVPSVVKRSSDATSSSSDDVSSPVASPIASVMKENTPKRKVQTPRVQQSSFGTVQASPFSRTLIQTADYNEASPSAAYNNNSFLTIGQETDSESDSDEELTAEQKFEKLKSELEPSASESESDMELSTEQKFEKLKNEMDTAPSASESEEQEQESYYESEGPVTPQPREKRAPKPKSKKKTKKVKPPTKRRETPIMEGDAVMSDTENDIMNDSIILGEEQEEEEDFEIGKGIKLSELDDLKTEKIKRIMIYYNLTVCGRKAEMIQRLRRHFKDKHAGRRRVDSLAPSPSPRKRRSSLIDGDDVVGVGQKRRFTRTKPCEYWNNERVKYSRQKRKSGDFATVVDIIREPDTTSDCLPPSKRRKYREEPFPTIPVYSTAQDKDVKFHAVKNQSMLQWGALEEQTDSISSDVTTYSNTNEKPGIPVHHAFAFNNDFFATGQLEIAPNQTTPMQNTRGSHEFFYIVAGTAEFFINQDTFQLKRGCHIYVPPVNDYCIRNPTKSSYLSVIFFRSTEYNEESDAE